MDTIISQSAIIYNKQNMASVISAAVLLNELPDASAFDVGQLINDEHMCFIWVGVDPVKNIKEFYQRTKYKQHVIIVEPEPVKPLMIQLNPFKTKFPEMEDSEDEVKVHELSLLGLTCKEYNLNSKEYEKLDFHIKRFYNKDAEIESLAYVYTNLQEAERSIASNLPFVVKGISGNDIHNYLFEIKHVKTKLTNSYRQTTVMDGEKPRNAFHTCISDSSYHLALRLVRLSHKNFLNTTLGMSGMIAYTNLRHLVLGDQFGQPPLILN